MRARLSSALVLLLAAASAVRALPVTLDRISYPVGVLDYREHPRYPQWLAAGVPLLLRQSTYIACAQEPAPADVDTVVLIVSGQQRIDGGADACGTGQPLGYLEDWGTQPANTTIAISDASIAASVLNSGVFAPARTFVSLVFDSRFQWESTANNKRRMEAAYTAWLGSKASTAGIRRVVLLGASRGGALVLRLARSLRTLGGGWATADIFVGAVDAVPNVLQGELRTDAFARCDNPRETKLLGFAQQADLVGFYAGVKAPVVRHVVTGNPVVLDVIVHSLCAPAAPASWYTQTWETLSHEEICRGSDQTSNDFPYNADFAHRGWGTVYDWIVARL